MKETRKVNGNRRHGDPQHISLTLGSDSKLSETRCGWRQRTGGIRNKFSSKETVKEERKQLADESVTLRFRETGWNTK